MIVKRFGCTAIHNKALYKCIIHSFIHYRKMYSFTKADSFPIPRMEVCVDRVKNATFVTKLDLLKGYWQVPLTSL